MFKVAVTGADGQLGRVPLNGLHFEDDPRRPRPPPQPRPAPAHPSHPERGGPCHRRPQTGPPRTAR